MGFDYKTSKVLGEKTLGGHNKTLCTPGPRERSSDPQETEPGLPVSVQESLAEAWVNSGLPRGQGP